MPDSATETATAPPAPRRGGDRRRAALLATAVALPLTIVLVLLVVRAERASRAPDLLATPTAGPTAPALPAVAVPAPPALSATAEKFCAQLIAALPTELGDLPARPVDSSSPYVAAWGQPPVTLRCGVARPPTFLSTAEVQIINGVTWFPERRGDRTAWVVVDRPVYVELVAPVESASTPAARLSTPITAALRPQPLDPAD